MQVLSKLRPKKKNKELNSSMDSGSGRMRPLQNTGVKTKGSSKKNEKKRERKRKKNKCSLFFEHDSKWCDVMCCGVVWCAVYVTHFVFWNPFSVVFFYHK